MEDFKAVFENAENSSFLKGEDGGWKASFDWLIKEANMLKVLEGNYADKPKRGRKENLPGWFGQREQDEEEKAAIQRMLAEDDRAEADKLRRELQEAFGGDRA